GDLDLLGHLSSLPLGCTLWMQPLYHDRPTAASSERMALTLGAGLARALVTTEGRYYEQDAYRS
ncbi:MAG: hypothetical protein ACK2VD_23185, partial [Anaerolineae bacterium]